MTPRTWTDEEIARVQILYDGGYTMSHIGKELSATRNAISGLVHRRIKKRPPSVRKSEPIKRREIKTVSKIVMFQKPEVPYVASVERQPRHQVDIVGLPGQTVATQELMKLGVDRCKWPIGNVGDETFKFCREVTEPFQSYCEKCRATARAPKSTRPPMTQDEKNLRMQQTLMGKWARK